MKKSGFTLIEVVLSMTILAFLTVLVTQSMRRGADFKNKIQKNIDLRATVNSAMRIIERDINLAFHYQDVTTEVLKEVEKSKLNTQKPPAPPPSPNNPNPNSPEDPQKNPLAPKTYPNFKIRDIPNYTAFVGTADSIHFTNLNNFSTLPGHTSGDQQEVGYFLKSCKSLTDPDFNGKCLWRRSSSIVDDKVDDGGGESVLIEGVTDFELRYFGQEKEDWVDKWDSTGETDATTKGSFPEAVEVTITVEKNKKEVSAIRVIPLRFPNNRENKSKTGGGSF